MSRLRLVLIVVAVAFGSSALLPAAGAVAADGTSSVTDSACAKKKARKGRAKKNGKNGKTSGKKGSAEATPSHDGTSDLPPPTPAKRPKEAQGLKL